MVERRCARRRSPTHSTYPGRRLARQRPRRGRRSRRRLTTRTTTTSTTSRRRWAPGPRRWRSALRHPPLRHLDPALQPVPAELALADVLQAPARGGQVVPAVRRQDSDPAAVPALWRRHGAAAALADRLVARTGPPSRFTERPPTRRAFLVDGSVALYYLHNVSDFKGNRNGDIAPSHPARRRRRLPDDGRHPAGRHRRRRPRAARAAPRRRVRCRRHRRRGDGPGPPAGRGPGRVRVRPAPWSRRRGPHRLAGPPARRGRGAPRRRPRARPHARSSRGSTAPWSRRSSSCAATTGGSPPSCARSPSPARSPTPPATRPTSPIEDKVQLLETLDVTERLELALSLQRERLAELQVRRRIRDDVQEGAEAQQREYFLRKQMESIRKELGEDDASVVEEYRTKIDEAGMPDDVREQAERELDRLERMGEQSGEASMIRTYLDWLMAVPWNGALRRAPRPRARPRGARTPTTPGSRTSRTASPSTSRSGSCARSAASPRTSAPARS